MHQAKLIGRILEPVSIIINAGISTGAAADVAAVVADQQKRLLVVDEVVWGAFDPVRVRIKQQT